MDSTEKLQQAIDELHPSVDKLVEDKFRLINACEKLLAEIETSRTCCPSAVAFAKDAIEIARGSE